MENVLDGQEVKNFSVKSFRLRYEGKLPPPDGNLLTSPDKVVNMIRGIFHELDGGETVEHFAVIYLTHQNKMIGVKAVNTGTVDQVAVYPRLIIHTALMIGASGIILIHNHPSGACQPSDDDKRLTFRMSEAAKLFDIRVLDHIILGHPGHYSFMENGLPLTLR